MLLSSNIPVFELKNPPKRSVLLKRVVSAPLGTGSAPLGTGSAPLGTGSAPLGIGSAPLGTGSAPLGIGSAPLGTGSAPLGIGSASLGTGSASLGIGSAPLGIGRDTIDDKCDLETQKVYIIRIQKIQKQERNNISTGSINDKVTKQK